MDPVGPTAASDRVADSAPVPTVRAFIYDRHATFLTAILDIRLDRCRGYAESRGWEVAGIWLDLGDHALSDDHRPQFDAMCRDLEASMRPDGLPRRRLRPPDARRLTKLRHAAPHRAGGQPLRDLRW